MLKKIFDKIKNNIELYYLLIVFVTGLIVSLLLPIGQTPDELVHMKQMCDAFGFNHVYDQYVTEIYNYNLVESAFSGEKIDRAALSSVMNTRFDMSAVEITPRITISMLSYLPAFIGFAIGFFLHQPIWLCVWLAELCNLIFASVFIFLALKYMPIKKNMLMAVMILPMCIQQYGSINYDAVLLPLCFFLFAYCAYLKIDAKEVKWKDVIIVLAVMLVVATIKPPYALIGLIALTIPYNKISILIGKPVKVIQKYPLISIIIIIAFAVLGLIVLKDQRYVSLIVASFINPVHFARLLYNTITHYFEFFYISTIGNLGYLSMPLPKTMVICIYILLVMQGLKKNDRNVNITVWEKVLYLCLSIIILALVCIAMISHTFLINGLEYGPLSNTLDSYIKIGRIEGIQGRYFIPVLPLVLMCFDGVKFIPLKLIKVLEMVYYAAVPVSMIVIICSRFW